MDGEMGEGVGEWLRGLIIIKKSGMTDRKDARLSRILRTALMEQENNLVNLKSSQQGAWV